MGGADGAYFGAHRNGHRAQVHADERAADVNACVGLDPLHGAGGGKSIPGGGGEGAAGLQLGLYIDHFQAVFQCGLFFDDNGAVQVLAALGSQVEAVLSRCLIEGVEFGFSNLLAGLAANRVGSDLAG